MLKRLVNLPFTVASKAARAFQEREDAKTRARYGTVSDPGDVPIASVAPTVEGGDAAAVRITAADVRARQANGERIVFVDVRTSRGPGIPGSLRMPASEIGIRVSEIDPDHLVVAWCDDGVLATDAVRFFRERGMEDTWALAGGLGAWRAAGGTVE
jgi:rhodanese-related sulfurtransferase